MRQKPKRQKPKRTGARREFPKREFGRQVDADLTEAVDLEDPGRDRKSEDSAGFTGAEFPEIDPDSEPAEAPVITPAITPTIVRERAMRLLVHREHGRHELEQKLLQRELPVDLIASVLDQLAEEGLQCDTRFAESYTRMRVDRGFGVNKIRADLQARRLEQSVVEEAIRDSGADWNAIASSALAKKFGSKAASNSKARAKMQRFLYQRGFTSGEIRSAMKDFDIEHSQP